MVLLPSYRSTCVVSTKAAESSPFMVEISLVNSASPEHCMSIIMKTLHNVSNHTICVHDCIMILPEALL